MDTPTLFDDHDDDEGPPTDEWTLGRTRAWLRARVETGSGCPCCEQFAKVYRRKITGSAAWALIQMWRAGGHDLVHVPTLLRRVTADESKLAYWGLTRSSEIRRDDGGKAGWWAVTELGRAWIYREATVPTYARVYDGRVLNLEGDPRTIVEALGTRFNYRELMEGI